MISRQTLLILGLVLTSLFLVHCGHTGEEWKTRSIYQLLTDRFATDDTSITSCETLKDHYCGGTFNGIIEKLDYIKGMGFNAIWISPIPKNKEGSFHSYHTIDFYEVNEHFGTKADLKKLVEECHKKDIWVIFDVVFNHVATLEGDDWYTNINPFNKLEYYHTQCDVPDDATQEVKENCWIWGLPDLNQTNTYVHDTLLSWIKEEIIEQYNIDGLRIADANNVPKTFWKEVVDTVSPLNIFTLGNVGSEDAEYVGGYQEVFDGMNNYPLFYSMKEAFSNKDLSKLKDYRDSKMSKFSDTTLLGVFVDNHDNPRFLNYTEDKDLLKNAVVFSSLYEGIPIFYYGDEQYYHGGSDPNNREILFPDGYDTTSDMYTSLKKINDLRKSLKLYNEEFKEVSAQENFYAYTRGDKALVAITNGKETYEEEIKEHSFKEGDKVCNLFDKTDCVTVTADGLKIKLEKQPKVYYKIPSFKIKESKGLAVSKVDGKNTLTFDMTITAQDNDIPKGFNMDTYYIMKTKSTTRRLSDTENKISVNCEAENDIPKGTDGTLNCESSDENIPDSKDDISSLNYDSSDNEAGEVTNEDEAKEQDVTDDSAGSDSSSDSGNGGKGASNAVITNRHNSGLSGGAIFAIVIISIIVLALVIAGILLALKKNQNKQYGYNNTTLQSNGGINQTVPTNTNVSITPGY